MLEYCFQEVEHEYREGLAEKRAQPRGRMLETLMNGRQYEEELADLFRRNRHIARVEREPKINGKTPDILIKANDGFECVVECTEGHLEAKHDHLPTCEICVADISKPTRDIKLHNKIEEKLKTYPSRIIGDLGYVIAVHNMTLESFDISALSVCFSQRTPYVKINPVTKKTTGHGWERALDKDQYPGLLEVKQNRHCSGVLITKDWIGPENDRHLFIPNPEAAVPVPEYIFDFARISELTIEPDGSTPSRAPKPYQSSK